MNDYMDEFFKILKSESTPFVFSNGVNLSRIGEFKFETELENDEITLNVYSPLSRKNYEVSLWIKDNAWSCNCDESSDPCTHVIASVLKIKNHQENSTTDKSESVDVKSGNKNLNQNLNIQRNEEITFIRYELNEIDNLICIDRFICVQKDGQILEKKIIERNFFRDETRIKNSKIKLIKEDLGIDLLLKSPFGNSGSFENKVIDPKNIKELLNKLSFVSNVFFENQKIQSSREIIRPSIEVHSRGENFILKNAINPFPDKIFENGAAIIKDKIYYVEPISYSDYSQKYIRISDELMFSRKELGYLISELIPYIQKKHEIIIKTDKLPSLRQINPRIVVNTESLNEEFFITPHLVYGDPEIARVINNKLYLQSTKIAPLRDINKEAQIINEFEPMFKLKVGVTNKVINKKEALLLVDRFIKLNIISKSNDISYIHQDSKLSPLISFINEQLSFQMQLETENGNKTYVDGSKLLSAWKEGKSVFEYSAKNWVNIPEKFFNEYGTIISGFINAQNLNKNLLPRHKVFELLALEESSSGQIKVEGDLFLNKFKESVNSIGTSSESIHSNNIINVENIEGLNVSLRNYQHKGVAWLKFLKDIQVGGILADDMGLGKTLQAICSISPGERTLIVAPTSVLSNWINQIKNFRPCLKATIYHGKNRNLFEKQDIAIQDSDSKNSDINIFFDCTITSYAILRLDINLIKNINWDYIILDESQNIKNPESLVTKAAYTLQAKSKLTITGTPIENDLKDLWSQFNFLNPNMLRNKDEFDKNLLKPIVFGDKKKLQNLKSKVKPFILRRLKKDVAKDLPSRTDITLQAEFSEEERKIYNAMYILTKKEAIENLAANNIISALSAILRLRQACCHFSLIPGQYINIERSAKIEVLIEHLNSSMLNGHKALVFSQWTSFLDLIEKELNKENIVYSRLDGTTKNRSEVVDAFQTQDDIKVMLLSLKAGGVGITLTAADHVYIMDPWWNPFVEEQAADRAHRIGQVNPVIVHRIIVPDTIEENILILQSKKKEVASLILDNNAVLSAEQGTLTKDDLLALLD